MTDDYTNKPPRFNPFGDMIGLKFSKSEPGHSRCSLEVTETLFNPNRVVHGGVIYSLADTGMGAALHSLLGRGEICATIEIKIVYLKAVRSGILICDTKVIHKGNKVAVMESEVRNGEHLVAKTLGTFSILQRDTWLSEQ